jgi:hypothetical protein
MNKQNKRSKQWGEDILKLIAVCEEALENLTAYEEETGGKVKAMESEDTLFRQLQEIQSFANRIHGEFCSGWATKFFKGIPLTPTEYYLMRAAGIHLRTAKMLGLSQVDDFEAFSNLCYEDHQSYCYIAPEEEAEDSSSKSEEEIRIRLGQPPEELRARYLRREQRVFFEQYLPDILDRLGRTNGTRA